MRVSCAENGYFEPNTATYLLQVFDAGTRRLLASTTSLTPSILEVTDIPAERSQSGLVLSLRIMTAHATSDATVLHSHHFIQEGETLEHQRFPGRETSEIHPIKGVAKDHLPLCQRYRASLYLLLCIYTVRSRYLTRLKEMRISTHSSINPSPYSRFKSGLLDSAEVQKIAKSSFHVKVEPRFRQSTVKFSL